MKKLAFITFMALMASPQAYSQIFKVNISNCGVLAADPAACGSLREEIQNKINEHAPGVEINKYADGMARANKISAKGGTTDYANSFEVALFSASVNAGFEADISNTDNLENTASGVSIAPSLLLGLNLGVLPVGKIGSVEMKDVDLFISFMSYNNDKFIDQDSIVMGGDFTHFGMQLRYHWLKEKDLAPGYMLQWTGLQFHTGYQFTKNKLNGHYTLNPADIDPITYTHGGQTVTAQVDSGSATANIEHSTHTIPLEISTGIRFLYLFSIYGGLGTDFSLSSSSSANVSAVGQGSSTTGGVVFDMNADQEANGKADFFNTRAFAGVQFNIPFVRVFAQGHKYFGSDTYGVNAGVKFLY